MRIHACTGLIVLVLGPCSVPRFTAAQQTASAPGGVPVQIVVSVEPKHGNEIPEITQRDVIVHQGHDVRPVTAWVQAAGNRAGLGLAVLIDDSASASFGPQIGDIKAFIQEQAPATQVAVGYMRNGTVFLTQNFTQDHMAAAKSVRLTEEVMSAEASPYLSLSEFVKRWPSDPAVSRREILMITSGIDMVYWGAYPNPYVEQSIRDAQCAGVVVYTIYAPSEGHFGHSYWLTYWGQNYLAEISEETGGESYYLMGPPAAVSFAPYLDNLNHQLPNQFLLTFLAEAKKKGEREPVRVSSEITSVDFVHQAEVCVPPAPE